MLALQANAAYAFITGVLATVNPCGFVLLPTYLTYFLGVEGARPGTQRAALTRALLVSGAVSAGFFTVFLVIGIITRSLTDWIQYEAADYLSMAMGALMIAIGVAMLFGKHLPFVTPKIDAGGRSLSVPSMFVYGMSYAIASIGCTLPVFTNVILGQVGRNGFLSGVTSIAIYGLGMGLTLSALTVSLALARTGLLALLRRVMTHLDLVSGVVLVLAGAYLLWYGYSAKRNRNSTVTDRAFDLSAWFQNRFLGIGAGWLFAVLGGITLAAIGVVMFSRRRSESRT